MVSLGLYLSLFLVIAYSGAATLFGEDYYVLLAWVALLLLVLTLRLCGRLLLQLRQARQASP